MGVLGHSDEGRVHGAEVIDLRAGASARRGYPFGHRTLVFLSVSFRNERNVKPRTYPFSLILLHVHSLRKKDTGTSTGRNRPIRVRTSRSTGGGELFPPLRVRRRRGDASSEEAEPSSAHSSPARSLYATKSRPQVRGPRSNSVVARAARRRVPRGDGTLLLLRARFFWTDR